MKTTIQLLALCLGILTSCAFGQGTFTNCAVSNQLTVGTTLLLPGTSSFTQNGSSTATKWVAVTGGGSLLLADNNGSGTFSEIVLSGTGTETLQAGTTLFLTGTTGIPLSPGASQLVTIASNASGLQFLGSSQSILGTTLSIGASSTLALSGSTVTITGSTISVTGSPIPSASSSYDIGSSGNPWRNGYFNGTVTSTGQMVCQNQFWLVASGQGSIQGNGDKGVAIVCAGTGPNVVVGNTNMAGNFRPPTAGFSGGYTVGDTSLPFAEIRANHYVSDGTGGGSTTVAALSGAGSGPTVAVSGNDSSGYITVTTGTVSGSGDIVQLNFGHAYGSAPHVIIAPAAANTGSGPNQLGWEPTVDQFLVTTAHFQINGDSSDRLASSTTYVWWYKVEQ